MIIDRLWSAKEVAEYLNVLPITVRRKAHRGEIPSIKIGHRLRFDKKQIDKWLQRSSRGRPIHILVVDDEPLVGQLFKESLTETNYRVTTTLSSLKALELIGNEHFDLIFLDLIIPELDGVELFRRIRQMDKDVPVIIITGYPDSDLMKRAMEYGPFTVIKKPFTGDDIISTARSFVNGVTTREKL
jgi:excisionase family DNA binding protein